MELALEQLERLFEDKAEDELRTILTRHNFSVEAAVEAICTGEGAVFDDIENSSSNNESKVVEASITPCTPCYDRYTLRPASEQDARGDFEHQHGTSAIAEPVYPLEPIVVKGTWVSPTSVSMLPTTENLTISTPTTTPVGNLTGQLLEDRRIAKEEEMLKEALQNSMAPTNRGLKYISDDELSELMEDPAFLASLDQDLWAAVELQIKLEAAESEWQSIEASRKTENTSTKKSSSPKAKLKKLGKAFLPARSSLVAAPKSKGASVQNLETTQEENEEEEARRKIQIEALAACVQVIKDHLDSFLVDNPGGSYEEWIEQCHPENTHHRSLSEGLGTTIDHRFYVEESDHRRIWNESLSNDNGVTSERDCVPARYTKHGFDKNGELIDFLP